MRIVQKVAEQLAWNFQAFEKFGKISVYIDHIIFYMCPDSTQVLS